MDIIRQFKGIFLETPLEDNEHIDEYIDLLIERLISSYRIEDQIESMKALLTISKIQKYQIQLGAKIIDPLLEVVNKKVSNELTISALECLKNIVSSNNESNETPKFDSQFSEILLKDIKHLALIIKLTEEYEFSIKYTSLLLFKALLINATSKVQCSLLKIENGISKILELLNDTREVIRNEALVSLIYLSKGNLDLQKIIAFENAFEIIQNILTNEDFSNGGVVTTDCLKVLLNLLKNNQSNMLLFREQNYIQKLICPFFDSIHSKDIDKDFELVEEATQDPQVSNNLYLTPKSDANDVNASPQTFTPDKCLNITLMLKIVKVFISSTLNPSAYHAAQKLMFNSGLLQKITSNILMSSGVPTQLLIQALLTTGQIIKGCKENQEFFVSLVAPFQPPRYFLEILLNSMLNEKKPLRLRRTILHFFHSYMYHNNQLQMGIISSLVVSNQPNYPQIGHILVNSLLYGFEDEDEDLNTASRNKQRFEPLTVWFASLALSYTLMISTHSSSKLMPINRQNADIKLQKGSDKVLDAISNTRSAKDALLNVRIQIAATPANASNTSNNQQPDLPDSNQGEQSKDDNFQFVSFMDCLINSLKKTKNLHSKIGLLILLAQWLADSPNSVRYFANNQENITLLISLINQDHQPLNLYNPISHKSTTGNKLESGDTIVADHKSHINNINKISNQIDPTLHNQDIEDINTDVPSPFAALSDIIQSLGAFCYGLCMYFLSPEDISTSNQDDFVKLGKAKQETLKGIVSKRLGLENYVNKLSKLSKFELLMLGDNVDELFELKSSSPTSSSVSSFIFSPNKDIGALCILDQEIAKTFHFYETFILKLFDDQMSRKDDYKLDQIDFVTNKYRCMIAEKDTNIEELNVKCQDYEKQMCYLTKKYEELNNQMKTIAFEHDNNNNTNNSNIIPRMPTIPIHQTSNYPYQTPFATVQQQYSPFTNGPYGYADSINPNAIFPLQFTSEGPIYSSYYPPPATYSIPSPYQLNQNYQNYSTNCPQLFPQTLRPTLYNEHQNLVFQNIGTNVEPQQLLNMLPSPIPVIPEQQNFYLNGLYYDVNSITLTNVRADATKSEKDVESPNFQILSNQGDINAINAPHDLDKLKEENERLKLEVIELKGTMAKLQKEQEGFMILIEDYENQLETLKRAASSEQPQVNHPTCSIEPLPSDHYAIMDRNVQTFDTYPNHAQSFKPVEIDESTFQQFQNQFEDQQYDHDRLHTPSPPLNSV